MIIRALWHEGGTSSSDGEDVREASKRIRLVGCQLTRKDLEDLLSLLLSDAGEEPFVTIGATEGITEIKASALDEFLSDVGEYSVLKDFAVHVSPRGSSRSTRIHVFLGSLNISVTGEDETWVLGRTEALKRLLSRTRSRWLMPVMPLMLAALFCSCLGIIFSLNAHKVGAAPGVAMNILVAAAWIIIAAQYQKRKSLIVLVPRQRSWWRVVERGSTLVVALGTIVIVLFTILLWMLARK